MASRFLRERTAPLVAERVAPDADAAEVPQIDRALPHDRHLWRMRELPESIEIGRRREFSREMLRQLLQVDDVLFCLTGPAHRVKPAPERSNCVGELHLGADRGLCRQSLCRAVIAPEFCKLAQQALGLDRII